MTFKTANIIYWIATIALAFFIPMISRLATPERISDIVSKMDIEYDIDQLRLPTLGSGDFLSLGQGGFDSNMSGILYQDGDSLISIDMTANCEDYFHIATKQGFLITKDGVCVIDESYSQRFVPISTILSGRDTIMGYINGLGKGLPQLLKTYSGIDSLLTSEDVYIDQSKIDHIVKSELPHIIKDKAFIFAALDQINNTFPMFYIIATSGWIFGSFVVAGIILLILLLYTLVTRVIGSFFSYPKLDYDKSFSISRLPFLVAFILLGSVGVSLIVFVFIIIILFAQYKSSKGEDIPRDDLSDLSNKS